MEMGFSVLQVARVAAALASAAVVELACAALQRVTVLALKAAAATMWAAMCVEWKGRKRRWSDSPNISVSETSDIFQTLTMSHMGASRKIS
jgi:hypothetical protein